jgi:selenocysteine lyase/cysteine desulfurase
MTYDVHALRAREFPWMDATGEIYLNSASTGPLPARTVRAMHEFIALRATPQRLNDAHLFGTLARSRELVAQLIGARTTEIALATNTTYGLNLAAAGLPLGDGDVVVLCDGDFPANIYPWEQLAPKRGATIRRIPTRDGLMDEAAVLASLDDPRVKVVSLSWVGFATGYRADINAIGRRCRERGIWFVVDAIQGLGPLPLDAHACEADIIACGAQKWLLSPWGAGFVYVREELARTLEPPMVSWMAVRGSDDFRRLLDYDLTWRDDARRFEFITLPFQDFAGMNASLELLLELGPAAIERHVGTLVGEVAAWAQGRTDVSLVTPADPAHRAGIVCVRPRDAEATSRRLAEAGIAHSQREGAIRLAVHAFTTREEIARALAVFGAG